jgi:outer membrane lipoprotein LolB
MALTSAISPVAPAMTTRAYLQNIDLSGRLSVRYQRDGKDESLHGNFTWNQTPAQTGITLLSPLGQTVASIAITPEGASLQQSGNVPPRTAPDVDELVTASLGWPLPIAGLRYWLQGFGTDASGNAFVASPQAPDVTTKDGWRLRYVNWQDDTPNRPKRIDLERWTAQAGDVAIRIVIDTWQ